MVSNPKDVQLASTRVRAFFALALPWWNEFLYEIRTLSTSSAINVAVSAEDPGFIFQRCCYIPHSSYHIITCFQYNSHSQLINQQNKQTKVCFPHSYIPYTWSWCGCWDLLLVWLWKVSPGLSLVGKAEFQMMVFWYLLKYILPCEWYHILKRSPKELSLSCNNLN